MKKLIALASVAFLVSCSDDSEKIDRYTVSMLKIDSVDIPKDTVVLDEIMNITTYSTYRNWCDKFYTFQYQEVPNSLERRVRLQIINDNLADCGTMKQQYDNFTFNPKNTGTYILKFWNGDDNWIEKQIVVQ